MKYLFSISLLLLFTLGCGDKTVSPEVPDVPEDAETDQRELWQRPGVVVSAMGDLEEA